MKKLRHRKIRMGICILAGLLAICLLVFVCLCLKNPNPDRPDKIENPTGFVKAVGSNLYDGDGNLVTLRGVNLGNWFVQECYMSVVDVGDFDTGVYTQKRAEEAMRANPNLTEKQIQELYDLYMSTYITEEDFAEIAALGLNTVRINFTWMNLTADGKTLKEDAFRYLDFALEMCEQYGLYAILDLHGAIGSQNKDFHSGDDAQFELFENEENRYMTVQLWKTIAERYRDRKVIAGYDLLNEPRRAVGKYGGKVTTDFYDELYKAVREVDENHMIFIEYFTFPIHGSRVKNYDWKNVCLEYHIYNNTFLPQKMCLMFYNALHNFMGSRMPVFVGEWNAWDSEKDWNETMDYFEKLGWSYASWAYKTNSYSYRENTGAHTNWGIYELEEEPVDLSAATYEEIARAYENTATENAKRTLVYEVYEKRFGEK